MTESPLGIRAGSVALEQIRDGGLSPGDITVLAVAAGGTR
jgi:hypothetical protein